MNEEEIKAIEYWKEKLKDYKKEIIERQNDEFKGYGTLEDIAKLNYCTLHTVLNLIEKQKAEIKKLKRDFEIVDHECSRLEQEDIRKDKIINEMVNFIKGLDIDFADICNTRIVRQCDGPQCKDCIIKYIENKVKESK